MTSSFTFHDRLIISINKLSNFDNSFVPMAEDARSTKAKKNST